MGTDEQLFKSPSTYVLPVHHKNQRHYCPRRGNRQAKSARVPVGP